MVQRTLDGSLLACRWLGGADIGSAASRAMLSLRSPGDTFGSDLDRGWVLADQPQVGAVNVDAITKLQVPFRGRKVPSFGGEIGLGLL